MSKTLYLELSNRSKQIFKTVIESYLESGEPVGSETLSKNGISIPIDPNLTKNEISFIINRLNNF